MVCGMHSECVISNQMQGAAFLGRKKLFPEKTNIWEKINPVINCKLGKDKKSQLHRIITNMRTIKNYLFGDNIHPYSSSVPRGEIQSCFDFHNLKRSGERAALPSTR